MSNDKALVTLLLGESYQAIWERHVRRGWQAYAERHGYDLIVLTEPLVDSDRPPHWQKLLVPSLDALQAYDFIVWIDSDVQINFRTAPCIVSQMRSDKIGGVDVSFFTHDEVEGISVAERYGRLVKARSAAVAGSEPAGEDPLRDMDPTSFRLDAIYAEDGFTDATDRYINGGVLVLQPRRHAALLTGIYAAYAQTSAHYENTCLSYELLKIDYVEFLDPRFNFPWVYDITRHYPFLWHRYLRDGDLYDDIIRACVNTAHMNNWFLHFAGANSLMKGALKLVDHDIASALDVRLDPPQR